ncbi:PTS transporter subunit IIC [Peribacillus loiseleuriae]|uniref:PTS galactitol transporter subunit IIC n=1 Tax=Peribacillus loiseleuriae TaxID=1679170 RepID=A0A0K9GSX0_9BACI|nr:PTS transporter subunit IIC [Peribacillus loiseleuriae]KMY49738.1 PTS galactitol transporter subunit IIC [Peribacillus loiseleuriae]
MDTMFNMMRAITDMGATAILPIIITVLGLVFRMKIGYAIKSGLLVGVGFLGLTLVVNLLNSSLKPAVDYYVKIGSGFTIADIGWPAVGAASWVAPFAALAIPLGLIINLALVRLRWTKTLNVDIWNYMHFLIPGALVYFLFDSFWLGLIITLAMSVIALFIGDLIASKWQEYFGLEGTTCTTIIYSAWGYPIPWLVNKIIDFIPGVKKWNISLNKINKKIGVLGDPVIIGFIVGVILGLITKRPVTEIVPMAMGIAGVMVLMPKVVAVMMEGLSPIGKSAKDFMIKRMGDNSKLNVGMDISLGLGDPTTITTTVISIPLVMLFALILPGVEFFPIGLLMSITYISVMCTLTSKGNLFRSIVSTVVFCIITFYLAGYIAPGATQMLTSAGVQLDGLGTDVTLSEPWNLLIYWVSTLAK